MASSRSTTELRPLGIYIIASPEVKIYPMLDKKLIFLGGKGGVGKTTLSSALSLLLSQRDRRTLLISTDPAHSLSDVFGLKPAKGTVKVNDRLEYLEIDPYEVIKEHIKRALESIESFVSPETFSRIKEAFHNVEHTPGAEEAAVLERLSKVILENLDSYDHFVVDTAPTGHTLNMLRTVGRVGSWLEELLKRRREAGRFKEAGGLNPRDEKVLEILRERRERFARFSEILFSKRTLFVPVLIPERLPIMETERLVAELKRLNLNLEYIFVNKVLPPETTDSFLLMRKEQERRYMKDIKEKFSHLRLIEVSMKERDVEGIDTLKEISTELERRLGA